MPRPRKYRRICVLPENSRFGPLDRESSHLNPVVLHVEEYETIRLIDLLGFTQEDCAAQMNVARTTVQAIYNLARQKLASSLVEGRPLHIEGGAYALCSHASSCCGKNCNRPGCSHRNCDTGRACGNEKAFKKDGGCKHEDCCYL